ncbi:DUF3152 domain-containing protein [Streptomyces sp. NPDC046909]|uniref:DUF3152 domain-containing protein n=1 Tax=Streptomyces sp. NPDC046909 TaxID=3155617 RepID=UPI0033F204B5
MTAHKAKASRSRRSGGRRRTRSRRHPRGRVWAGLAALAVLGAAGFVAVDRSSSPVKTETEAGEKTGAGERKTPSATSSTQRAKPAPASSPSTSPSPSQTPTHSPSPSSSPSSTSTPTIPANGPGTFVTASGGSPKVGAGKSLRRYRVEVETGLALSTSDVAEQVDAILADPRGWTADGIHSFQRISSGAADFVVKVATPGTVDRICATQGLDTGGEYNCSVGTNVMVNLKRWELATKYYADDVRTYRGLIINHEVGHFLGHNHVTCPGPGKPAPAMMQQIKGLKGCVPNVWPYDAEGNPITGPAAP